MAIRDGDSADPGVMEILIRFLTKPAAKGFIYFYLF